MYIPGAGVCVPGLAPPRAAAASRQSDYVRTLYSGDAIPLSQSVFFFFFFKGLLFKKI